MPIKTEPKIIKRRKELIGGPGWLHKEFNPSRGRIFCQAARIKHSCQLSADITMGYHAWKGGMPALIKRAMKKQRLALVQRRGLQW